MSEEQKFPSEDDYGDEKNKSPAKDPKDDSPEQVSSKDDSESPEVKKAGGESWEIDLNKLKVPKTGDG